MKNLTNAVDSVDVVSRPQWQSGKMDDKACTVENWMFSSSCSNNLNKISRLSFLLRRKLAAKFMEEHMKPGVKNECSEKIEFTK